MKEEQLKKVNQELWDHWASLHPNSEFYDTPGFIQNQMSLNPIELDLLPNLQGKKALHMQCHFGQDTISLKTLGAKEVVGLDFSATALAAAEQLVKDCNVDGVSFVQSDACVPVPSLKGSFDIVYASYGVIGWHPNAQAWIDAAFSYLRPGGELIFVEFHPVLWILDHTFTQIVYSYFNDGVITETSKGSYAAPQAKEMDNHTWNHGLSEVLKPVIDHPDRSLVYFNEYDWSPYEIFNATSPAPGKYQIKGKEGLFPLVYAFKGKKIR